MVFLVINGFYIKIMARKIDTRFIAKIIIVKKVIFEIITTNKNNKYKKISLIKFNKIVA